MLSFTVSYGIISVKPFIGGVSYGLSPYKASRWRL